MGGCPGYPLLLGAEEIHHPLQQAHLDSLGLPVAALESRGEERRLASALHAADVAADVDHVLPELDVAEDLHLDLDRPLRVGAVGDPVDDQVVPSHGGVLVTPAVAEELELLEETGQEAEWTPLGHLLNVDLLHGPLTSWGAGVC